MATINPSQDYDVIHTLTCASSSGTVYIRLFRGSITAFAGTVYYRAGTSGAWTALSVSDTSTPFPITSTTMQVAHDWNKSGNNYMTPGFYSTNITAISISQKAVLSGTIGGAFMRFYAESCTSLTSIDVPDTSSVTSVGDYFMSVFCTAATSLTYLDVPNTSNISGSVGASFMSSFARDCAALTTLGVPDTSGITSAGERFMQDYASGCSSLVSLSTPDVSNVTTFGNYSFIDYASSCASLETLAVPDTSSLTNGGLSFMYGYASGCSSLTELTLPAAGWFKANNVNWSVPSGRLGILKGHVLDSDDLADWQALTVSGKTLYTNYIQSASDVDVYTIGSLSNFLAFFYP